MAQYVAQLELNPVLFLCPNNNIHKFCYCKHMSLWWWILKRSLPLIMYYLTRKSAQKYSHQWLRHCLNHETASYPSAFLTLVCLGQLWDILRTFKSWPCPVLPMFTCCCLSFLPHFFVCKIGLNNSIRCVTRTKRLPVQVQPVNTFKALRNSARHEVTLSNCHC